MADTIPLAGGEYHLFAASASSGPEIRGNGCCCLSLPCVMRNMP
jgi:hypothetical protein